MKITNISVKAVEVPLTEPFHISLGTIYNAVSCVVRVETDEGLVGWGEGAPGVLITGENRDGCIASIREHLAPALIGCDPTDLEKVYWIMDRAVASHGPCGKTALDIACHDLLGKKGGLPVYKLLGGERTTSRPISPWASISRRSWRPRQPLMLSRASMSSRPRWAPVPRRTLPA